jgi:hypothetical protein
VLTGIRYATTVRAASRTMLRRFGARNLSTAAFNATELGAILTQTWSAGDLAALVNAGALPAGADVEAPMPLPPVARPAGVARRAGSGLGGALLPSDPTFLLSAPQSAEASAAFASGAAAAT